MFIVGCLAAVFYERFKLFVGVYFIILRKL